MTSEHKAWNWKANKDEFWHEPCEESYWLVHRWKEKGYTHFLDLGCGLGRHSMLFARNGFEVAAIDLSPDAVACLGEKARSEGLTNRVTTQVCDMAELPFPDESFDCLLAFHVISHTTSEGIRGILREVRRVLKPGGEFYLTLCSKDTWSYAKAGFPRIDEHTVIKQEDGPEDGIPHFFADEDTIFELFAREELITVRHIKERIVAGRDYGSWHWFILGKKD